MKRNVLKLFVLALLLCCLAPAALANETRYVLNPDSTDRLNLRAAPRQSALSLGKYYNGTPVCVLGSAQNGYAHVSIGSVEGYMLESYLSYDYVPAMPTLTVTNAYGTGANVREQPAADADVVYFAQNGETLAVMGVRDDDWLHVVSEGNDGFVLASLLTPQLSYHKANSGSSSSASGGTVQVSSSNLAVITSPDPKDRLNLRASKSKDAPILGKYFAGTVVTLLKPANESGWVWVCIGDSSQHSTLSSMKGYVQSAYLEMDGDAVQSAMPVVAIDNPGGLHLRMRPSTSSQSLGLYEDGTLVTVMGVVSDDWCHVLVDGQIGFMMTDKLEHSDGLTFVLPE